MSEKTVREAEKELKAARIREKAIHDNNVTKNRDFTLGIPMAKEPRNRRPSSGDVPNAITLPKKSKPTKENIPY
tara:strand:+ start:9316 stop:9537 length:222 start_codon:yes stop_codon:yes gene_type:complete